MAIIMLRAQLETQEAGHTHMFKLKSTFMIRTVIRFGGTLANINNLEPYSTWKFQAAVINNDAVPVKNKGC